MNKGNWVEDKEQLCFLCGKPIELLIVEARREADRILREYVDGERCPRCRWTTVYDQEE